MLNIHLPFGQSSKYQKNKKNQKAPKQAIKEATKKAKRNKVCPISILIVWVS